LIVWRASEYPIPGYLEALLIRLSILTFALSFLGATVLACGDDEVVPDAGQAADAAPDADTRQAVTINFAAKVGAMDAACGQTYTGQGVGTDQEIEFKDLRFYVSNVRLINDASEEVAIDLDQASAFQTANVALLDFEDNTGVCAGTTETNTAVTGKIAPGTYSGLVFDVAVPFDLNHDDLVTLPSPLNISSMFWAWAIGHKFIRIDLDVIDGATRTDWNVHLGSTACGVMGQTPPTEECAKPNRPEIRLAGFDPASNTVNLDIEPLLADSDLTANVGMAPGCQSFPDDVDDCTPLFPNLGIDYGTGACINGCADQSAFVME